MKPHFTNIKIRISLKVLFVASLLIICFCPAKVCQAFQFQRIPSSYTTEKRKLKKAEKRGGLKGLFDKDKEQEEEIEARKRGKEIEKTMGALGREEIRSLTKEEIEKLTPEQIGFFTPEQIRFFKPGQIQALSPEQIVALRPEQIQALTPEQIEALTPDQLRALLPVQLRLFSGPQIKAIPAKRLWALTSEQLWALTTKQLQALTPEQLWSLSIEQKRALFKEPGSDFEKFVAGMLPKEISRRVNQFGYDLFRTKDKSFFPFDYVPVSPEYVIGPGDEIKINLWGKVEEEEEYLLEVDRDGKIIIPSVGVLSTAGLTFKELKEVVRKKFQQYLPGSSVHITLNRIRTIKIYVVGKAKSPGTYNVSGMSTLINALFITGGPSKIGSMRHIRLMRNNQVVSEFDLYDFILKGDKSKDARLEPGDVIFIPPIGDLVAVVGNVKDPAIYELKDETGLTDFFESIGGVSVTGHLKRIQVERIEDSLFKELVDKDISDFTEEDNISLKNGDIIKVFPVSTVVVNRVTLKGNVVRPGGYEWHEGMRASDIIPSKDLKVLKEDTLLEFARIERRIPPDFDPQVLHFNLGKATEKEPQEDIELKPFDVVTVFNKWEFREKPVVRIAGAVNMPGKYEYKKGMKISDIVKLAGGLKTYTYNQAELTRVIITQNGPLTERMTVNLSKDNPTLHEDDYLLVRTIPDWNLYYEATIIGEVNFPGTYTVKKGERLTDLIERAGGFTKDAYLKGTVFTRESVQEHQQKMLEQGIDRMERDMLSAAAAKTATALTGEESQIFEAQTRQLQELIERLRTVEAIGRLVIKLPPLNVLRHTPANVELEDGDEIFIPSRLSTINVMGSVYNPSTYIYDPKVDIDSYIDMAGGTAPTADAGKAYVVKVDGSALSYKKIKGGLFRWNTKTYRWEVSSPSKTKLDPGDTIIVPEKLERLALLRGIKDISLLLFQMAVTTGVVLALPF